MTLLKSPCDLTFEIHGTNQSEFIDDQRLPILYANCLKEKPRRHAHFPQVVQRHPRLASITRGPTGSPMCRAQRRQSRESRDEPSRGSVRRGGACVGSVLAADKEGDRILVVELSEFLLEGPRDGRRKRPPICFVRQATHRVVCIVTRSLSSTVTSAC